MSRTLFRSLVLLTLLVSSPVMGQMPSPSAFGALNAEVVKRYRDGDYRGASEIAKRLLEAAREALDPKDPALFTYINNLGFLYQAQGRQPNGGMVQAPQIPKHRVV